VWRPGCQHIGRSKMTLLAGDFRPCRVATIPWNGGPANICWPAGKRDSPDLLARFRRTPAATGFARPQFYAALPLDRGRGPTCRTWVVSGRLANAGGANAMRATGIKHVRRPAKRQFRGPGRGAIQRPMAGRQIRACP